MVLHLDGGLHGNYIIFIELKGLLNHFIKAISMVKHHF